jgi:hypothetical protein
MMTMDIGTILDGLILVLLCVTIFYAARLSMFMTTFRESRADFDRLMGDLGRNILRAEQAIATMRELAANGTQELRDTVNDSKFLSDELRFMNEAGDSLANRLEKLAERNRELVDLLENAGGVGPSTAVTNKFPGRSRVEMDDLDERQGGYDKMTEPFFKIQDREYQIDDSALDADDEKWDADDIADGEGGFQSQAERDLYEALQKGRRKSKVGGVA